MILFLTDSAADYAADYLLHGFCSLLGPASVIDWPAKPSLHRSEREPLIFDCDQRWPQHGWTAEQVVTALHDGRFEAIIVPTLRGHVGQRLLLWRAYLRRNADRLVFCDGEDHALNMEPQFTELAGVHPVAHFKRELPIGERWAQPLPFGYPAERMVLPSAERQRAAYIAHVWPWAKGKLRERLGQALTEQLNGRVDLHMTTDERQNRLSLEAYHARLRQALVAVSPAGQGWSTNRHLELVADGCCPVIEEPWVEWPGAFCDGVECRYFRNELDAAEIVEELLGDPDAAVAMAQAAQAKFLLRHTTVRRAETVLRAIR